MLDTWNESDRENSILKAIDMKTKEISDEAREIEDEGRDEVPINKREKWQYLMGCMHGLFLAGEIVKYGHQQYMKEYKINSKNASYNIVSTTEENNALFRECERDNVPFFAIRKDNLGYYVEYDFITTEYQLKETICNEIKEKIQPIIEKRKYRALNNNPYLNKAVCQIGGPGQVAGYIHLYDLDLCEEVVESIKKLITTSSNWEFRKR